MLRIPTQQIATIGDMPNDMAMFEKSWISIAMGQAAVEVRSAATHTTSSSEEEGFAKAVEDYVLNPFDSACGLAHDYASRSNFRQVSSTRSRDVLGSSDVESATAD